MANFKQAVKWMKEGKKVRRASTPNGFYKMWVSEELGSKDFIVYEHIKGIQPEMKRFQLQDFESVSWEIYEEDEATTKFMGFKEELAELINKHCIENKCDVPDFILADMICNIIEGMGGSIKKTLDWHGCDSVCHPKKVN